MKKKLNSVLLIDDDRPTNVYNKAIVNQADVTEQIDVCHDGQEALDFLKSTIEGDHPRPSLIFLDVNMPGMNGWEFLEAYNALPANQKGRILVFMLTTSLDPEDEGKSLKLGADGFIRKPLTPELVLQIAKEYFPENF
ncbi:MAG: response regulator [Flavobacteriales bacterium]